MKNLASEGAHELGDGRMRTIECAVSGTRRERDIDIVSQAFSFAILCNKTLVDGIISILMNRDEKRARVVVEDLLRSISVMDVPIDDGYLLETIDFTSVFGSDGNVVEDAKAETSFGFRVVSWRAN